MKILLIITCLSILSISAFSQLSSFTSSSNKTVKTVGKMGNKITIANIKEGTFTDKRDGQLYKTVTIAGKTWLGENLKYKNDSCWANNADNSSSVTYGYLYNYNGAENACPDEWHIATREEWEAVFELFGGEKIAASELKDKEAWKQKGSSKNSNKSKMSLLPGGSGTDVKNSSLFGKYGYYWTSTDCIRNTHFYYTMYYDSGKIRRNYASPDSKFSVRCVKN